MPRRDEEFHPTVTVLEHIVMSVEKVYTLLNLFNLDLVLCCCSS